MARLPRGLVRAETIASNRSTITRHQPLPRRYGPVCESCWLTAGLVRAARWCPHGRAER